MQFSWKNPLTALPVLLLLATHAGAAWALAGNVQFVIGDVKLINRAGQTTSLKKGAEINEGDRIVTAEGASAQIKMVDGGFIAVRPNTNMAFDTYRYNGKEDGSENAVVSLLQGGFRTITGVIGRTNKQNYMVKTDTSTIGIRGTDHEPMVILAPRPGQVAIAPPGTYDKVNVGVAFIRNEAGTVDIQRNQVGYVPDAKAPPRILPSIPPFYKPTPSPGPQKAKEEAKDEGKKEGGQPAGSAAAPAKSGEEQKAAEAPAQIRNTAVVDPASTVTAAPAAVNTPAAINSVAIAPVVAVTATGASGTSLNTTTQTATTTSGVTTPVSQAPHVVPSVPTVPAGPTPAVPVTGGSGTYRHLAFGAQTIGATTYYSGYSLASGTVKDKLNYLFDASGNLVSIVSTPYGLSERGTSGPPSYTANTAAANTGTVGGLPSSPLTSATVAFAGGTTPDANYNDSVNGIRMGRYLGGTITTTDTSVVASPVVYTTPLGTNSFNWAVRELPLSIPITGSFEYMPAFVTKPTDSLGNTGALNYASLTANFSTQTVNPAVGITINNQTLSAAATNVPINSQFGFDVSSAAGQNAAGGNLQVTCSGTNCAPPPCTTAGCSAPTLPGAVGGYGGRITGGFAGATAAAAAMFRYNFNTRYDPGLAAGDVGAIPLGVTRSTNDYIQGLVAFNKGTDVAALALSTGTSGGQLFNTSFFQPPSGAASFSQPQTRDYSTSPTGYTSAFGTGSPNMVTDYDPSSTTPHSETLTGATVAQAPTNANSAAATGVSFGRYTGGTLSGNDWNGTAFSYPGIGNYAWVKGPDTGLFLNAMRGTAKYAYDGGTLPASINGGVTGSVNSAVLAVNFNSASVGIDLSVSVPASGAAPAQAWTATTNASGALSTGTATPATTLRLDEGKFRGSNFQVGNGYLHESLYVKLNGGTTNASGINGMVSGQLTGANLSGAGMSYAFQDFTSAPGTGVNGALALALSSYTDASGAVTSGLSAIDPNNIPYAIGFGATGLNNDPSAGPQSPAAVEPGRYLTQVDGRSLATARTILGASGMPTVWDGALPMTTVPTCVAPATCSPYVNEIPARFSIDPGSFVATGGTPTAGTVVLPAGASPAAVLESGFDAKTGIRWGRYGGGVVAIFDRVGGTGAFSSRTVDLSSQNWHFILSPAQAGPVALPVTGTYTYTNAGGTSPTNNIGSAAGTLNAATLVADFGAQTVNAGVNLTVNGQTWAAGASGIPIQQRVYFEAARGPSGTGNLNICTGAACGATTLPTAAANTANTSGRIVGAFTGSSGQGAGVAYSLNQGGIAGTTVTGVTAFRR